jgi:hypothetical protein
MELFGIALSIPVAFVASMLYCLFLTRVVVNFERPSRWLRFTSLLVLALFAAELALLVSLGSVRSRGLLGPSFYVAHVIFFFLGAPALANLLVLRPRRGFFAKWYVAGALCTVFAFFLVLLQYTVSESLYGIDGDNGPYSDVVTHDSASPQTSTK